MLGQLVGRDSNVTLKMEGKSLFVNILSLHSLMGLESCDVVVGRSVRASWERECSWWTFWIF